MTSVLLNRFDRYITSSKNKVNRRGGKPWYEREDVDLLRVPCAPVLFHITPYDAESVNFRLIIFQVESISDNILHIVIRHNFDFVITCTRN